MDAKWDRIQDALGAAIRGDEIPPVVSQRTLFGIPSSVEVRMARFAAELAQEQADSCKLGQGAVQASCPFDCAGPTERDLRRRVACAAEELGERVLVGRAIRYFIYAGRSAGFDIPAYPFDPKGELKDFLRSCGAANLPEYYATLGVPFEHYDKVQTHALLVLDSAKGERRTLLLKGAEYCEATTFLPLRESRITSLCDFQTLKAIAEAIDVR